MMRKKWKKTIAVISTVSMAAMLFAGCGSSQNENGGSAARKRRALRYNLSLFLSFHKFFLFPPSFLQKEEKETNLTEFERLTCKKASKSEFVKVLSQSFLNVSRFSESESNAAYPLWPR